MEREEKRDGLTVTQVSPRGWCRAGQGSESCPQGPGPLSEADSVGPSDFYTKWPETVLVLWCLKG